MTDKRDNFKVFDKDDTYRFRVQAMSADEALEIAKAKSPNAVRVEKEEKAEGHAAKP